MIKRSQDIDSETRRIDNAGYKFIDTYYSCQALFFVRISPDDKKKYKRTIKQNDVRYRQVKALYANVKGNIMPYNNTRTFRPQMDNNNYNNIMKLHIWNNLLNILSSDLDIAEEIKNLIQSLDIDCIIIKDTVQSEAGKVKPHKPLRKKLFDCSAPQAIYRKDISYDLNKQATTFGEMFGIHIEQYTLDNYKANSCFLNLIVDMWHQAFEKRKKDGKRIYVELTYESVCNIIGLKYKNQDVGISIRESVKFFKKFHLGLDVVNAYNEMLYFYRPPKLNSNISNQVLRVFVHNNHTYKIDDSAKGKLDKMRQRFISKTQLGDVDKLFVSNKFNLRQPVLDNCEMHFIDSLDQCIDIIKEIKENTKIRFITNANLLDLLFQMNTESYTPSVIFAGSQIISLGFKVGKVNATIEKPDNTAPDDNEVPIDNMEDYLEYHKADDEFYGKILHKSLKSEYPDSVLEVETKYPMGPTTGYLTKKYDEDALYNAIDTVKAYTHCLRSIENVPVFGYFDTYVIYDNHPIEDTTMYCVEYEASNIESSLLFPSLYSRCFGFQLQFAIKKNLHFAIKYFRRPCNIENVNYKEPIDKVFANPKLDIKNTLSIKQQGSQKREKIKHIFAECLTTLQKLNIIRLNMGVRFTHFNNQH